MASCNGDVNGNKRRKDDTVKVTVISRPFPILCQGLSHNFEI